MNIIKNNSEYIISCNKSLNKKLDFFSNSKFIKHNFRLISFFIIKLIYL